MRGSVVYTLHLWPPLGHAAHYTGSTPERRLARRLTDHALGRGARLTQVQAERGGSWVLAQTQPGDWATERRLKQHGATRRCEVCKAAGAYQSGELTAPEALARAGWDRSNEVQRSLLLDIFGLPKPPEDGLRGRFRRKRRAGARGPSSRNRVQKLGPRLTPSSTPWSTRWFRAGRTPQPDAQPQPEPLLEAGL